MPVEGNTQPFGLLHGGASCVLAESVGSIAANIHGAPTHYAVGIEISCSHHSGARSGHVTATATPLKAGRQLATYNIEITDDAGLTGCHGPAQLPAAAATERRRHPTVPPALTSVRYRRRQAGQMDDRSSRGYARGAMQTISAEEGQDTCTGKP